MQLCYWFSVRADADPSAKPPIDVTLTALSILREWQQQAEASLSRVTAHVDKANILAQAQPVLHEPAAQQERSAKKGGAGTALIVIAATIAVVLGLIGISRCSAQQPRSVDTTAADTRVDNVTPTEAPTPAPTAVLYPELPRPANGATKYYTDAEPLAPLEVNVPASGGDCYLVLCEYATKERVASVYLYEGVTYEVLVPLGEYKLYYSSGDTWYGTKHMFGENGAYGYAMNCLSFYDDGTYYCGHTITLTPVVNGNMVTGDVSFEDFPTEE